MPAAFSLMPSTWAAPNDDMIKPMTRPRMVSGKTSATMASAAPATITGPGPAWLGARRGIGSAVGTAARAAALGRAVLGGGVIDAIAVGATVGVGDGSSEASTTTVPNMIEWRLQK